jgi:cation transport regulator ChaB
MPYSNIGELPEAVRNRYSPRCQKVFLDAFNRAVSAGGVGGALSEEKAFKVAHTAAGLCKDSGKSVIRPDLLAGADEASRFASALRGLGDGKVSKAEPLDADEMEAWFQGKLPRRLLAIPFTGPIPGPDGKGRDLDMEFFDERTDIKPDWFEERPVDWHHSQDPSGKLNGVLIGKAKNLQMDEDGWWVDLWLNAGERRLGLIRRLAEKGAELFGSSYAYPNLVKRGKAGHIDVWPYMMQTLSTSPQNTNSVHRPAKAVLDAFTEADIAVEPVLRDVLAELATLRDLPTTFPAVGSESAAKAGRELSGANLSELDEWLDMLDSISKRAKALRDRVRTKYQKPEDVSST